jgi:hypothetical protein
VQVLAVEQRDELRVLQVVVPGERDQLANRLDRVDLVEVQPLLGFADVGVGALEHREEQVVLAAEVVVDEALVQARALGDAVHARAGQAAGGELVARRREDGELRAVGIARTGFEALRALGDGSLGAFMARI